MCNPAAAKYSHYSNSQPTGAGAFLKANSHHPFEAMATNPAGLIKLIEITFLQTSAVFISDAADTG